MSGSMVEALFAIVMSIIGITIFIIVALLVTHFRRQRKDR